jgi:tetratricopeptide (TPR) repeat protein
MSPARVALIAVLIGLSVVPPVAARADEPIVIMHDRAKEKQQLIDKLKRDILKVDRTIAVTRGLIVQSKAAPYLPDLFFRLAELYVEKSRYMYVLQQEESTSSSDKGSIIAPEVRLLKEKALQTYRRIINEFPDYRDNDKVLFFIAHENRELGKFDEMLKVYEELIDKHPKSPLVDEALYIVGDYYFDKQDQAKAEHYYQQILDRPHSPSRQLALYKLGFIRLWQKNFNESFRYFELAAKEPLDETSAKALTVRREALTELVYVYTEIRPAKDALAYFEALCSDSDTLVFVLEKLGNRYWIRQEWENAAPIYRRLLTLNEDGEKDPDRAQRMYDAIRNSKGKVVPTAEDVRNLVRVAARARSDYRETPEDRAQIAKDFEVYARDLATKIQVEAQKSSDKTLSAEAAAAYGAYLSLFHAAKQVDLMRHNHAEALFASEKFVDSGREYEVLAKSADAKAPNREDLIYSAILAYYSALRSGQALSQYETVYARAGIEQLGAFYVKNYPRNDHAAEVKFNVARAYYDEGNFKQAGEQYASFVNEYPTNKDVSVAAHLALDAFHNLGDYDHLVKVAQTFIANPRLPPTLVAEIREIANRSRNEEIDELALRAGETTGDIGQGLLEYAEQQKGTEVGERTLHAAFMTYRDKHDVAKMKEVATKLLTEYPKSKLAAAELITLGRALADAADYENAAQIYEEFARRFPQEPPALDAQITGANIRLLLGDDARGIPSYEKALAMAPPRRRSELGVKIADAYLKSGDEARAQSTAMRVLQEDPGNAEAAVIVGKVLLSRNQLAEAQQRLSAVIANIQKNSRGGQGEGEAAGKVFFLLGEVLYRQFQAIPEADLEKRVALVEPLTQAYTGAAQLGAGEDAVGGVYRIGLVYQAMAEALTKVPEPAGLTAEQKTQFHAQVDQQALPLKNQAEEAFTTCLRKTRDLEVVSPYAAGCRTKAAVSEKAPIPSYPHGGLDNAKVQEFRLRLQHTPDDGEALLNLGELYLAAGDVHRARLVLNRLLEVTDTNSRAQSDLAVALWRLGEVQTANGVFRKALELDSGNDKARANLAAMYCLYGDVDGAKKEIASLKNPPQSAFDVEGSYTRCQ